MGFTTASLGLGTLTALILVYKELKDPQTQQDYQLIIEMITCYGLGGSAMALFGRISGGIYSKASDVGTDLLGKVEYELKENSVRNPGSVADCVGDNVADVVGMGSDLFGSFAEASCATLVLIASNSELMMVNDSINHDIISLPLLVFASGIAGSFIASFIGTCCSIQSVESITTFLNIQQLLSTIFTLGALVGPTYILPSKFKYQPDIFDATTKEADKWYAYIALAAGSVGGYLIRLSTNYYTNDNWGPVREMAVACTSGPAINIIYGLALGFKSTILPVLFMAIAIIGSVNVLGVLGIALCALGMLCTFSMGLSIDTYAPIANNARGIGEMAGFSAESREVIEAMDSSGNITGAVGKGLSVSSAALVALAIYAAFIAKSITNTNHPIRNIDLTDPWIFTSLLIGAMLPFAFSALTMKSVTHAADEMVKEVREEFKDRKVIQGEVDPDYQKCIATSTRSSVKKMIIPSLIVIITPIFFGIIFHPAMVAGLIPGTLLSGVQMAISMCNSGSAWDNCKKFIEGDDYINSEGERKSKGSDEHDASIVGNIVGDPLKDASGPSLNVLIKLMAIISLVFVGTFEKTSLLSEYLVIQEKN
jgi:inorganic pyrophosphatase